MKNVLKVSVVKEESQGKTLGIKVGDVIASYNGDYVDSNNALSTAIYNAERSKKKNVKLSIRRGDQALVMDVTTKPLGIECTEVSEVIKKTLPDNTDHQGVVVKDVQMPFNSMVVFMVKWAVASIPALIILAIIFSIVSAIFGSLIFGG